MTFNSTITKQRALILLILPTLLIVLHLSTTLFADDKSQIDARDAKSLTVMSYNVENLFDTQDDPEKDDETYLPLKLKRSNQAIQKKCKSLGTNNWKQECLKLDWSESVLKTKLKRLADVILKSHNNVGPDILILQEVENIRVLEMLRTKYLSKYYPHTGILVEGPDKRGIDVAILSKLKPYQDPQLHLLQFKAEGQLTKNRLPKTRGVLEANFKLSDSSILHVFAVHFPSQGTPTPARKQALDQLVNLMKTKPATDYVIAGGDFNITSHEESKNKYFHSLKNEFLVSHLDGCKSCRGTNYFHPRKSWSFLDALIFSDNFKHGPWTLDKSSVRVFNSNLYQNNRWGSPMKFEEGRHKTGVSDHWPIMADVILKRNSLHSNQ